MNDTNGFGPTHDLSDLAEVFFSMGATDLVRLCHLLNVSPDTLIDAFTAIREGE